MSDLRHGLRIGGVELRRMVRRVLGNRRQLLALGVAVLAFTPFMYGLFTGIYAFGVALRTGIDLPILALARQQLPLSVGFLAMLFTLQTIERSWRVDELDLLLTIDSPRAIVLGILASTGVQTLVFFALPGAVALVAFCLGSGTLAPLVVVPLASLPLLAIASTLGFVLGVSGKLLARRVRILAKLRAVFLLAFFVLIFAFSTFWSRPGGTGFGVLETIPTLPVGIYADIFLVGTPLAVPLGVEHAIVAIVLLAATPALFVLATRLAPRLWYADPVHSDERHTAGSSRLTSATPTPFDRSKTGRVAWQLWVRGLRNPVRFVHLLYLVFMLFPVGANIVDDPAFALQFIPFVAAFVGAWLSGALFGLNPIGEEGAMLQVLVTVPTPGRTFLRARALAGLLVGLPVAVVGVAVAGSIGPQTPTEVASIAAFSVVLAVTSAGLALGVGSFAPRFEAVRAFGGTEAVTPTTLALIGHMFGLLVLAAVGFLLLVVPQLFGLLPGISADSPALLSMAGLAVVSLVLLAIGGGGYVYAARRFERYTVE